MLEGSGRYGKKGCSLAVRHADALRKTHHILKSTERYYLLGSCNELLLTLDHIDTRYRQNLMLWNPCIRKWLRIPPSPMSFRAVVYLFGFASCSKDYKVIETSFGQDGGSMSIAVYTLSDQQWSLRNNGLNMSFSYYKRLFWQNCSPKTGFIFQGAAHWISDYPNGDGNPAGSSTHLVSLDFDLEKFTYLELPFASDDIGAVRFPFRLRESLAVFCISSVKSSIWELKEVWTQRFSGLSSGDGFSLFSSSPRLPLFFYESDDGGCFVYGKKSYNIVSCQVHELGKSVSRYVDMQMYREGLVLCKGYGAKDLESCS
ncbi:putative F-box protein At5g47300 [Silene latifolia]|uniref:putative F-box protein At5g47300 n=1 Tax=Silene latifolia TaxID=37657 RepID=UPI003D777CC8